MTQYNHGDFNNTIEMKLRDLYGSLEQLCDDLDVSEHEITEKLADIDYHYDREKNQFV